MSYSESWPLRSTVMVLVIALVLVVTAITTFFISVRGGEETQVPAVVGEDLLTAQEQLQEKKLVARVEGRFSADVERWVVMAQTPVAGSLVKAGRPVSIVVSQGPLIAHVGEYVGRDIDEVRLELQTLQATYESPIRIGDSGLRVSDPKPAGTILSQSPHPGMPISEEVVMLFTVSRGPQRDLIEVPEFTGVLYGEVLALLAEGNQTFVFTIREGGDDHPPGMVVFQSPDAGSEVPHSTILQVGMTKPELEGEDLVFGLFEYQVPEYPILVDLTLSANLPGQREPVVLLETKYQGAPIAVPFVAHRDAELVLTVLGKQVARRDAARLAID